MLVLALAATITPRSTSLEALHRGSFVQHGKSPIAAVLLARDAAAKSVVKSCITGYHKKEGKNMPALDWSQCPAVESIPGKRSGAWIFRGTRTPVSVVFDNLEAGASIGEIMDWFHLSREQVVAVIEFAGRSLDTPTIPPPASVVDAHTL
jgi:uncharacterized protein (DUF433 family)